jgi:hemerythrin-like metal-binding protein
MMMEWGERYALGVTRMDDTHREFVDHYNALAAASPERFFECFDAFYAHTAAHFDQEDRWMAATNFPECHHAEHERVLEVMREVRQRVEQGDAFLGRRLVEELHPWFDQHVDTMDAALAYYLKEIGFDTETCSLPADKKTACDSGHVEGGCACALPAQTHAANEVASL